MKGADAIAGLRKADPHTTLAAISDGEVSEIDDTVASDALALTLDERIAVAAAAAWIAFEAARTGLALDTAPFARALRESPDPEWLLRAARELAARGPLDADVVAAIPWSPHSGDTRRGAARALTAHAIAANDDALVDRLLREKHKEFRAGVSSQAEDAAKKGSESPIVLRILAKKRRR